MRKIAGLVLIILSGNIMRIDSADENMITVTYEFLKIDIFNVNNRFMQRTGDSSIEWFKDADDNIYVWLKIFATYDFYELGYVCQKSNKDTEMDELRDNLVTLFLAQGKPCPIQKGTTSNMKSQVLRTQRKQGKSFCGSKTGEILIFDYKDVKKLIISVSMNITNSGCN